MKKALLILLFMVFLTLTAYPDYIALKTGKVYITDGKIEVVDNNAIFKIKGSDIILKISLDKVDIERTKKLNTPRTDKTDASGKSVKKYTAKDIKNSRIEVRDLVEEETTEAEQAENNENLQPWESVNQELFQIPDYSVDTILINSDDEEWWRTEVTNVQANFVEAGNYYRKLISKYNDQVIEFNSASEEVKRSLKASVEETGGYLRASKDLVKAWYSAMQQLLDSGRSLEKEDWLLTPLVSTLEQNKTIIE